MQRTQAELDELAEGSYAERAKCYEILGDAFSSLALYKNALLYYEDQLKVSVVPAPSHPCPLSLACLPFLLSVYKVETLTCVYASRRWDKPPGIAATTKKRSITSKGKFNCAALQR